MILRHASEQLKLIMLVTAFITSVLLIFFFPQVHAADLSQDTYPFTTVNAAKRFSHLTQEIRCVACQNQNLAESNAPLAEDLRNKIYEMVKADQSDQAIKSYLVMRYGDFILLKPPFNKITLMLWILPTLGLVTIFLLIFITVRRSRQVVNSDGCN